MGQPAAKQGDFVQAVDTHIVIIGPATATLPHPFMGQLDNGLSSDVNIEGKPAAVVGSTATNMPSHIPAGGSFMNPPKNQGRIIMGSGTVMINGKAAARAGDTANTCNDPADLPVGKVIATGTVFIGG